MEIWKDIPGFSKYQASNLGNIRHSVHKKVRSLVSQKGYQRCTIINDLGQSRPYLVHRLVYLAFVGPIDEGMHIDHINRIRHDNRLENLRSVTPSENQRNRVVVFAGKPMLLIKAIVRLRDQGLSVEEIYTNLKETQ